MNTPWYENLPVEGGVKYMGNIAMYVVDTQNATGIREGTTSIADGFNGSAFSKPSLPASLRRIGDRAFYASKFTTLVMPEGLEQMGKEAFYKSSLIKVTLNESLNASGDGAFSECSQLTLVNYNAINLQAADLFSHCTSLEKVNVGAKVRILPENAFGYCSNLAVVKFAERTDDTPFVLGDEVFYQCRNLTSLDLPVTTTEIGKDALQGCINIQNFIVPEQVTVLNSGVFGFCSNLYNVVLPDGLKIIGDCAFMGCYALNAPELPEGIDSIGNRAFEECYSFTEFTIPSTVTRMGYEILSDCYQLQKIYSRITHPMKTRNIVSLSQKLIMQLYNITAQYDPRIGEHYREMYSKITLTVPAGSQKRYRQTAGWSEFTNIVEDGNNMTETNFLLASIDTIPAGSMGQLGISLTNDIEDFAAYQFDLDLPLGIEMEMDADGMYKFVMSNRNDVSHTMMVEKLASTSSTTKRNRYRFVCISAQNAPIKGTSGILLEIPLRVKETVTPAIYESILESIIFTQQDGTENELLAVNFDIPVAEPLPFKYGDVNADGVVNVSDIVGVINHIMQRPDSLFNEEAADANQDGEINVSDVVKIVNIIMGK